MLYWKCIFLILIINNEILLITTKTELRSAIWELNLKILSIQLLIRNAIYYTAPMIHIYCLFMQIDRWKKTNLLFLFRRKEIDQKNFNRHFRTNYIYIKPIGPISIYRYPSSILRHLKIIGTIPHHLYKVMVFYVVTKF